jgi:hypothetical protein
MRDGATTRRSGCFTVGREKQRPPLVRATEGMEAWQRFGDPLIHPVGMSNDALQPFALRLQSRPSVTAEAVTAARALEHLKPAAERVVDDPWAELFLSAATRQALAVWSGGFTRQVFRRLGPTGTGYVPLRHRFIDDDLLGTLAGGVD